MGVKAHFILHLYGTNFLDLGAYQQLQMMEVKTLGSRRQAPPPHVPWRRRITSLYKWLRAGHVDCGKLAELKTRNLWKDPIIKAIFGGQRRRRKK